MEKTMHPPISVCSLNLDGQIHRKLCQLFSNKDVWLVNCLCTNWQIFMVVNFVGMFRPDLEQYVLCSVSLSQARQTRIWWA
jgi:hypothetical protein